MNTNREELLFAPALTQPAAGSLARAAATLGQRYPTLVDHFRGAL